MSYYENDDKMVDELYKIIHYICEKYSTNEIVKDLAFELEDVVVKIREEIGV